MDLPLILSRDKKLPLHQRLQTALISAIDQGRILPGASLPSSRELSTALGVSRPTVVRAYEELVRTGHLESRPGGKTYVAGDRPESVGLGEQRGRPETDKELGAFGKRLAALDLRLGAAADQPLLNFGGPPHWALPLHGWKQILRRNCANLDPAQFELSPHPFGHTILREVTADYLRRRQGVNCSADQLVIFPGSQSPLSFIAQLFIERGDNVVVEDPGHIGARNSFTACGANVLPVPVDDEGIRVDIVKQLALKKTKFVYFTPKFHDPTGVCMSAQRRADLLEAAAEHGILIVEDAWDSDYCYISPNPPALQSTSPDNVFYIYSFWKTLYPLSTVSCMVVPKQYAGVFKKAKSLIDGVNPVLEHYTLAEFIEAGHLERHLKTVTRQLTQQRLSMIEDLVSAFGTALNLPKQSAAFWLTMRLNLDLPEAGLLASASRAEIKMISTRPFYTAPEVQSRKEFLISFAEPETRIDFAELCQQAKL